MTIFMLQSIRRSYLFQYPALTIDVRPRGTSLIGWAEF